MNTANLCSAVMHRGAGLFPANKEKLRLKIMQPGFNYTTLLKGHYGCVNAIAFSGGEHCLRLCSGSDDTRVLVWDFGKYVHNIRPQLACLGHVLNIFCCVFDKHDDRFILSCGADSNILRYDITRTSIESHGSLPTVRATQSYTQHMREVYRVAYLAQSSDVFLSASGDGTIRMFDIRTPGGEQGVYQAPASFPSVACHPIHPHAYMTANSFLGVQLRDIRLFGRSEPVVNYDLCDVPSPTGYLRERQEVTGLVFNSWGTQAVATIRKCAPALLPVDGVQAQPLCTFLANGYRNSTTMKACDFVGENDEYIAGGSDNANLYMWQIPEAQLGGSNGVVSSSLSDTAKIFGKKSGDEPEEVVGIGAASLYSLSDVCSPCSPQMATVPSPTRVLFGHRSIPNHVCYNKHIGVLCSSGVEKSIRLWSSRDLGGDMEAIPMGRPTQAGFSEEVFQRIDNRHQEAESAEESEATIAMFQFLSERDGSSEDDTPSQYVVTIDSDSGSHSSDEDDLDEESGDSNAYYFENVSNDGDDRSHDSNVHGDGNEASLDVETPTESPSEGVGALSVVDEYQ